MDFSDEQLAVINAPLHPMAVVACAGSGKTQTAVRRLAEIRKRLGEHRGRVALLSFSNVAVNTFRTNYQALERELPVGFGRNRVEIDTLDGFITSNVLRPHGPRTMKCPRTPFLVSGNEPFLRNKDYNFWVQATAADVFPVQPPDLGKVIINVRAGIASFHFQQHRMLLPINNGIKAATNLAATGAYTHNLGRYWVYRVLAEQPNVLRALSRRYPHILIDEAQDIGTLHQEILEMLIKAGSHVSLIGDPNQSIYDFAGANGQFLAEYGHRLGVTPYGLTRNYRSVPLILSLANTLGQRRDVANRTAPLTPHGAFFVTYKNAERDTLIETFNAAIAAASLEVGKSAVLCRGRDLADELAGRDAAIGQGAVKLLARAAIHRDRQQNYLDAFKLVAWSIVGLLADPPEGLVSRITQPSQYPDMAALRRVIWRYTRSSETGLPSAELPASSQWHELLVARTKALLTDLDKKFELKSAPNLGNKLSKKALPASPLVSGDDLVADGRRKLRIDTVHQAKGESLDAVLYLATKDHVLSLIAGANTELGRIGYVAATRAKNLLWLGVPANSAAELRPTLLKMGFEEIGAPLKKG